ncbi:MAG: hypothetical protein AB8G14_04810 [Ilumatobacter sp.]
MWFGGSTVHPEMVNRLTRYGSGIMGLGPVKPEDLDRIGVELEAVGRNLDELELVSGVGGRFTGPDDIADLDAALSRLTLQT